MQGGAWWEILEATAGIEPAIRVLQTPALPLGYVASINDSIVPGPCVLREWFGGWRLRFYEALITGECRWAKTGVDGEPRDRQLPLRSGVGADACAADVCAALDAAELAASGDGGGGACCGDAAGQRLIAGDRFDGGLTLEGLSDPKRASRLYWRSSRRRNG